METTLPPVIKSRLRELFNQIEKEFCVLFAENQSLHEKLERLQEQLDRENVHNDRTLEIPDIDSLSIQARLAPKPKSYQQKLKTAHKLKAQTSKIVSSFKTPAVTSTVVRIFAGHRDGIWEVTTSDTSRFVLGTASADHTARIWHAETGECLLQYNGHNGSVNSVRFHPSRDLVLTASGDQTAHIWQAVLNVEYPSRKSSVEDEGKDNKDSDEGCLERPPPSLRTPIRTLIGHSNVVVAADWLPAGDQVITSSWDRLAYLYDVETGEVLLTLCGHDQELTHVSAHHTQKLVVTSSQDTTFRLWDFREPIHSVSVFQGHTQTVTSTVFVKNCDDKVVSGSDDHTVKVWDLRNMRSSLATIRSDAGVNRMAVSPSGVIAIPHDNRQIRLFDLNGIRIARLPKTSRQGHRRMVCGVAWREEATSCNFFSCGFDKLVLGWSIQSNKD